MGYPYYGRTDSEGRRFEDDRERWEERDSGRAQREGTRFDENPWRGREPRYYPGWDRYSDSYRPHYDSYRPNHEDERYARGREHDDRNVFERFGDRVREGLRRIGRGPKGYKRSDERITEDVCERIARSHINADNVEVKVKDGEVTLSGLVDARYDKRNLEDIADDVFGVSEVHNQLRVQQPATTQQRASTTASTNQSAPEKGRVTHS